jgi:Uma2 family endonuclease
VASVMVDEIEAAVMKRRHRVTVDEFHKMAEAGVLGREPRRYELIRGVIVERMGEGSDHMMVCDLIEDLLHRLVPAGYFPSMGHAITIAPDNSEPVPDAMVLRGAIRDYTGRRRTPEDSALVIEVSDSSLAYDRTVKAAIYAAAGVPVYWIVNIPDRVLEVRRNRFTPDGGTPRYGVVESLKSARGKAKLVLDGSAVGDFFVREILP